VIEYGHFIEKPISQTQKRISVEAGVL